MTTCGFKWNSPYLLPPGQREVRIGQYTIPVQEGTIYIEQECSLLEGHEGFHRSLTNVTHPGPPPRPKVDKPPATEYRGI